MRKSTQLWLVLIVAAVVCMAALAFLPGGPGAMPTQPPSPSAATAQADAAAQVERLQQKLSAAIQHKSNILALVPEAEAIIAQHPKHAGAHVTLGQILAAAGQHDRAYGRLTESLSIDANQPEVEDLAGSLAMQMQRYPDAQRHFSQAASLGPREMKYRLHLAVAQMRQDKFDEARNTLLHALKIDSSLHQAHALLADLYAQQNNLGTALDQIGRAIELLPPEAEAGEVRAAFHLSYVRKRAALLRRANRAEEALAVMRQIPPKHWMQREVIDEFAQTWMLLGKPDKAAEHYEAILPLDPLADWAAYRAAEYRLKAEQPDAARGNLDRLRRINPRDTRIPDLEKALTAAP